MRPVVRVWFVLMLTAGVSAQQPASPPADYGPADRAAPRTDQNSMVAHAQLVEKARHGRIDIYFEGDSIVRRWGALDYPELLANWTENFHGWNAADFAWGADRTQNILWRLQHGELDGVNPKVIVLLAGTNNVGAQPRDERTIAEIARGVKAIIDLCRRKAPAATILVTAIFPRHDNTAVMPTIDRINARIATFADGKRVRFLDINNRLLQTDGTLVEGVLNERDRLHPTLKGYQLWADALRPIFHELLGAPKPTDVAPPPTGDPSAARIPQPATAQGLEAIAYAIRIPAPATHEIVVEATVPAAPGRPSLDLMMPMWSPGYYRVEDYAANVRDLSAATLDGRPLVVEKTNGNHWRVDTLGERVVKLSYRVFCNQRSVTTNFVDADYGVFNGAPTFITLAENVRRHHEVQIELPPGWTAAITGLDDASGGQPNHFRAPDYETLVDSPIVAGKLGVRSFDVAGKKHFVVNAGDSEGWDGDRATSDLQTFVEECRRFWGVLPYEKYVFLLLFRPGGGGLEHRNSNLSTVLARPRPRADGSAAAPGARWPSLGLEAHEYFHLFNVKRLRPIELGPFNFEQAPTTGSLWIAEGVTSYYSGLLMTRAGLQTPDEYLASLSSLIGGLQNSPGRLLQSVERSSLEVWNNSNSGVNPNATTVSYYNKGNVLGLLLDAKIRRATNGRASFDDVMRLAYRRYGEARGYTADEFRRTAEEVAGTDLRRWFTSAVSSTDELDYSDLLEWYGLRFVTSSGPAGAWTLERRPDQSAAQRQHLESFLGKEASGRRR